jgi:hypothetical protein
VLNEAGLQKLQSVINHKATPTKTRKRSVGRDVHNNDNDNNDYSYDYILILFTFF